MLKNDLDVVKRVILDRPALPETDHRPSANARQVRSDTVLALRGDVRRLQYDIRDASDARDDAGPSSESAAGAGRIAVLEAELEQRQRDLARLQGRV